MTAESAAAHRLSPFANAQFPRALREPGRKYRVPRARVGFGQGAAGKYFYRVPAAAVAIEEGGGAAAPASLVIYGGGECCICLEAPSTLVLAPCGHFCVCDACGGNPSLRTCPLCRAVIANKVARGLLG